MTFDGSGDYLLSGYDYVSSSPWRLDEVTISSWAKFDDFPTSSSDFDTVVATDREGQFRLQVNSSGHPRINGYFYSPSGEQWAVGTTEMKPHIWYHLVGTFSEETDTLKIYLKGTLEGTDDTGTSAYIRTSSPNYLGRDYSGRYFDGTLDHVQIWQDDFTANEVRAINDNPLSGPRIYSTEH